MHSASSCIKPTRTQALRKLQYYNNIEIQYVYAHHSPDILDSGGSVVSSVAAFSLADHETKLSTS